MSAYCRVCVTKNGVTKWFILQYMWENLVTGAGVHIRLIWGPLNIGFTVNKQNTAKRETKSDFKRNCIARKGSFV